ncbi:hypothetical protein MRB53_000619 [Persea americana]|uniref:Uncharacterized protein n=1 Tax=Persea americana TaxID=3435 RepID=A0ACC2MPI5_PERAE|nr:hypothetical protein MRB53_000619 [Persea americana]
MREISTGTWPVKPELERLRWVRLERPIRETGMEESKRLRERLRLLRLDKEIKEVELIESLMEQLVRSRLITCPEGSHVTPFQTQQSALGVQEGIGAEPKRVSKEDFWSSRHWAEAKFEQKRERMKRNRNRVSGNLIVRRWEQKKAVMRSRDGVG